MLFYREKGHPSRPPLLLLHGLWGASDNWLTVAGLLEKDFHVILPDCRNHGRSPHLPRHRYADLCGDLQHFIHSLDLAEKPFVAGHSMGGKTLMQLLLKHPETAAKAAVIDIAPRPYPVPAVQRRLLQFVTAPGQLACNSRETLLHRLRSAFPEEKYVQLLQKNIRKQNGTYTWRINTQAIRKDLNQITGWPPSAYPPYPSPVLFISGGQSDYLSPDDRPLIRKLFPAACFSTVPQAGHWIHAEAPLALARRLKTFFLPEA